MVTPSFNMEEDLLEQIDKHLEYGDSRSGWVRDAIILKLEIIEKLNGDMTDEERRNLVKKAVREIEDGE